MTDSRLVNDARGAFPHDTTVIEDKIRHQRRETVASDWKSVGIGRPTSNWNEFKYYEEFSKSCSQGLRHADNRTGRAIIRYSDASADFNEFMAQLRPKLKKKQIDVPKNWKELEFALSHLTGARYEVCWADPQYPPNRDQPHRIRIDRGHSVPTAPRCQKRFLLTKRSAKYLWHATSQSKMHGITCPGGGGLQPGGDEIGNNDNREEVCFSIRDPRGPNVDAENLARSRNPRERTDVEHLAYKFLPAHVDCFVLADTEVLTEYLGRIVEQGMSNCVTHRQNCPLAAIAMILDRRTNEIIWRNPDYNLTDASPVDENYNAIEYADDGNRYVASVKTRVEAGEERMDQHGAPWTLPETHKYESNEIEVQQFADAIKDMRRIEEQMHDILKKNEEKSDDAWDQAMENAPMSEITMQWDPPAAVDDNHYKSRLAVQGNQTSSNAMDSNIASWNQRGLQLSNAPPTDSRLVRNQENQQVSDMYQQRTDKDDYMPYILRRTIRVEQELSAQEKALKAIQDRVHEHRVCLFCEESVPAGFAKCQTCNVPIGQTGPMNQTFIHPLQATARGFEGPIAPVGDLTARPSGNAVGPRNRDVLDPIQIRRKVRNYMKKAKNSGYPGTDGQGSIHDKAAAEPQWVASIPDMIGSGPTDWRELDELARSEGQGTNLRDWHIRIANGWGDYREVRYARGNTHGAPIAYNPDTPELRRNMVAALGPEADLEVDDGGRPVKGGTKGSKRAASSQGGRKGDGKASKQKGGPSSSSSSNARPTSAPQSKSAARSSSSRRTYRGDDIEQEQLDSAINRSNYDNS